MPSAPVSLTVEPLEAAAFAPFGRVLAFDGTGAGGPVRRVNEDTAWRADTGAPIESEAGTRAVLAFYRLDPQPRGLRLGVFERHPLSTQSFVSLSVPRFVVTVAPSGPDGLPLLTAARAFMGGLGTGVSYRRDLWHTPVMALGAGGDLVMLMGERGTAEDCIEHRLQVPILIHPHDAPPGDQPLGA